MTCVRTVLLALTIGLLPALALLVPQPVAAAEQVTVADEGPYLCTRDGLAEAIAAAATEDPANPGLVAFDCAEPTITFPSESPIFIEDGAVIIDGSNDGGEPIILDGNDHSDFFVIRSDTAVTIRHMTFRNGHARSAAAINNWGTLSTFDSNFISNQVYDDLGLGAEGGAIVNGGTLNITRSSFIDNSVIGDFHCRGGAIANLSGTLNITQSTFIGNRVGECSSSAGGAISNAYGGTATITQSSFIDNKADRGGAIENSATLFISQSSFVGNTADDPYSTLDNGGAINDWGLQTVITASTFSGNRGSQDGAAIRASKESDPVESITIRWSTFVQPEESTTPALHLSGAGSAVLEGVILAGGGDHCAGDMAQVTDRFTLANDDSCGLDGVGSQQNVPDLGLGELATAEVNGVTQSYYPLVQTSPAVDAGGPDCATPDQLGTVRPIGDACDIGAIEIEIDPVDLCANRWNGALRMPSDGCSGNETLLTLPDDGPLTICANAWNGDARYSLSGSCGWSETAYEATGDGSILVCVNRWNGSLRVREVCSSSERSEAI